MIGREGRVRSVTIVERRSAPGYRLVLCCVTRSGTPVLDTLDDIFASVESAERHAIEELHVPPADIRVKAGASA